MSTTPTPDWISASTGLIADPLRFKARLGIGERAYASLRLRNAAFQVWDVAGVAATGATIAKSSAVATALFSTGGFWAWFGFGETPATPIGWIVAAGLLSGATWYGVSRYFKGREQARVIVIPQLISTPLDELALAIFDLAAPLAQRLTASDTGASAAEHTAIGAYFTRGWGYDPAFVSSALVQLCTQPRQQTVKTLARRLGSLLRANPDCDARAMSADLLAFYSTLASVDGPPGARQTLALSRIERAFRAARGTMLGRAFRRAVAQARALARRLTPDRLKSRNNSPR